MSITQSEFEYLMSQKKEFDNIIIPIQLGPVPIKWTRQINSSETKEIFLLDFYRGSLELTRYTYNKRYRQTIILLPYDNGGRHTNPDGVTFDGPHVHIYKVGYDDKFAEPVLTIGVDETDAIEVVFNKIMQFCNVKKLPAIELPMF